MQTVQAPASADVIGEAVAIVQEHREQSAVANKAAGEHLWAEYATIARRVAAGNQQSGDAARLAELMVYELSISPEQVRADVAMIGTVGELLKLVDQRAALHQRSASAGEAYRQARERHQRELEALANAANSANGMSMAAAAAPDEIRALMRRRPELFDPARLRLLGQGDQPDISGLGCQPPRREPAVDVDAGVTATPQTRGSPPRQPYREQATRRTDLEEALRTPNAPPTDTKEPEAVRVSVVESYESLPPEKDERDGLPGPSLPADGGVRPERQRGGKRR